MASPAIPPSSPADPRAYQNGGSPRSPQRSGQQPGSGFLPDLAQYERLITHGLAAADRRDGLIDHVTARRLAIWFAAQPQEPDFARNLTRFINTGGIGHEFKRQLRLRSLTPDQPAQPQASQLFRYCYSRGSDIGWIGRDFGAACDRIDRADLMLAELHQRALEGRAQPEPAPGPPELIALALANPDSRSVSFVLDETTASTVLFAVAAHAGEREAHIREVERYGQTLPEGSWGRRNREAIAARETRIAERLRAVERAYRSAMERDSTIEPPPLSGPQPAPGYSVDRELEVE